MEMAPLQWLFMIIWYFNIAALVVKANKSVHSRLNSLFSSETFIYMDLESNASLARETQD